LATGGGITAAHETDWEHGSEVSFNGWAVSRRRCDRMRRGEFITLIGGPGIGGPRSFAPKDVKTNQQIILEERQAFPDRSKSSLLAIGPTSTKST